MENLKTFTINSLNSIIQAFRLARYWVLLPCTPFLEKICKYAFFSAGIVVNGKRPQDIQVYNKNFYARLLAYGELGLMESFLDGWIDAENFTASLTLALKNPWTFCFYRYHFAQIENYILWGWLNLQTIQGALASTKQYNQDSTFFEKFSGESLVQSAAYYSCGAKTLQEAQIHKMKLIATKLGLQKGMKVLDIGCGYGELCRYLAEYYDVEVVGITNAVEMGNLACIRCSGYNVTIKVADWRDIEGKFDRICCIEMSEHVGRHSLPEFFTKVKSILKLNGTFYLHVFTTDDMFPTSVEFMSKHMYGQHYFAKLHELIRFANSLDVVDVQDLTWDAWRTVSDMLNNLLRNQSTNSSENHKKLTRLYHLFFSCDISALSIRKVKLYHVIFVHKDEARNMLFPRI